MELKELAINKTTNVSFSLNNIGDIPLVIASVGTTCGCLVPKWSKMPIQPNETTEINVEVTPDKKGYFKKGITIYCNVENRNIILAVRGGSERMITYG